MSTLYTLNLHNVICFLIVYFLLYFFHYHLALFHFHPFPPPCYVIYISIKLGKKWAKDLNVHFFKEDRQWLIAYECKLSEGRDQNLVNMVVNMVGA